MDDLNQFIYYALKSDIFDPLTEHNLPQSRLKGLCVRSSQMGYTSIEQIKKYIYEMRIFHDNYWSSSYYKYKCQQCLTKHWLNSSSKLNLLDDDNVYKEFAIGIEKLSKYILINCRVTTMQTQFLSKKNKNLITSDIQSNRILIVGASSSGLISALAIFRSGLLGSARFYIDQISIIEKRNSYSRKQWFDLIGKPFYNTLDVLFDQFAFDTQTISYVKETNDNLTTILLPASVLERFLAKTVVSTGISISYNHEYVGYCKSFENIAVILNNSLIKIKNKNIDPQIWNCGQNILNLTIDDEDIDQFKRKYEIHNINKDMFKIEQFSLIIGCDGTKSRVRSMYKMGWYQHNGPINIGRFVDSSKDRMKKNVGVMVDNLHQLSLLVNFKTIKYSDSSLFDENNPYDSHNCPKLKHGSDNRILDPWSAGFNTKGVETVFKRFYHNDCQVQILLSKSLGDKLNDSLIWSIVYNVSRHYLVNPPSTIKQLQDKYLVSSNEKFIIGDGKFATDKQQILLLNHTVFLPKRSIKVINAINDSLGIVLLIGDSSMKSHYRLGVGINRLIDFWDSYLHFYRNIKETMLGRKKLIDYIVDFTKSIESKLQYFVEFQASTIYLESYCGFIIFFEQDIDNLNEAQLLTIRDIQNGEYLQLNMRQQIKLIEKCVQQYKT